MRILVCATDAPVPPMDGFRLQLSHLCEGLASRHEVCVLAYRWPEQRGSASAGVELIELAPPGGGRSARAVATLRGMLSGRPRRVVNLTAPMAAAISKLLDEREFDVAHVAGSSLAAVAPALGPLPAVLAALDAWHLNVAAQARIATPLKRPFYRLEERNVRGFGRTAYRPFSRVVVVSEADASALAELDPALELEVIPNGVDTERLAPNPSITREPGLVVFTGAMQWAPNAEAAGFLATEVLPRLRRRIPQVRLAIVGRNPGPAVRELAAIENVEVTGEVADVRPWLWRAEAFACPMVSGTGIKNKLLEALACEAPCVATPLSCQGIRAEPGSDLLVAESAEDFATALARVLGDPVLGASLGSHGRRAVAEGHSWESVARAYERAYQQALAG